MSLSFLTPFFPDFVILRSFTSVSVAFYPRWRTRALLIDSPSIRFSYTLFHISPFTFSLKNQSSRSISIIHIQIIIHLLTHHVSSLISFLIVFVVNVALPNRPDRPNLFYSHSHLSRTCQSLLSIFSSLSLFLRFEFRPSRVSIIIHFMAWLIST